MTYEHRHKNFMTNRLFLKLDILTELQMQMLLGAGFLPLTLCFNLFTGKLHELMVDAY